MFEKTIPIPNNSGDLTHHLVENLEIFISDGFEREENVAKF